MNGGLLDVLSDLTLVTVIFTKSSVPVSNLVIKVELIVIGVAGHELRLAQRKLMTLVCLPQVEDLAVKCDDLFHLLVLCDFPDSCGDTGRPGHEQHARLDFEDVRVPVFAFVRFKSFVEASTDHIFDADETSIGFGRVVEKALSHLWDGLEGY
jgi:hypothetical protein